MLLIISACGGSNAETSAPQSIKVALQNNAPINSCPNGGITVHSGVDKNDDLILQETEFTSSQYVCHGFNGTPGASGTNGTAGANGIAGANGTAGTTGLTALVVIVKEIPGFNCATGGSQVSVGFDTNQDKTLNTSEVTSSNYICNGANGIEGNSGNLSTSGTTGLNGVNGAVGANGAVGPTGAAGTVGATGTTGAAGTNGAVGAIGATGAAGAIGATGTVGATGVAGTTGAVGATGATGAVGSTGAAGTNGAAGAVGAVGAPGAAGIKGENGTNGDRGNKGDTGFKSLVAVSADIPAGICLNGGIVANSGIDTNANNSLDLAEITSFTYVCNVGKGDNGLKGDTGAKGDKGNQGDPGSTGATGPANGLSAYGYIYSLLAQDIDIGRPVVFEKNTEMLNIEHKAPSSEISIKQAGTYLVSFSVSVIQESQFALFVNKTAVLGSTFGSGAGTQQNNGQVIVRLTELDVVTLVNYQSNAAVGLQSNSGGKENNVLASITFLKVD